MLNIEALADRNAIVTGGSTGIGREVVIGLARLGAKVVFNSTENSRKQAEELTDQTLGSLWIPGDIRQQETINELVTIAKNQFGPPHILICCAGTTMDNHFLRMSEEQFENLYDVKVTSARRLTQQVLPAMKRAGFGRIVYVSSVSADGSPLQLNYAMANEALVGLTKSAALIYPEENISVNVVKPALVETKLTSPDRLPEKFRNEIIAEMPIGRILQPIEVAEAILMLVAQKTAAVNGHVLYVDGGMRRI